MARTLTAVEPQPEVGAAWAAQIAEQDEPADVGEDQPTDNLTSTDDASEAESAAHNVTADSGDDLEDEDDEPRVGQYQDPREAIVDALRRRLEAVLQPVDDDDAWHGVFAITRKDLTAVLMQPLPSPASSAAAVIASVWTPGSVFVEAVCPRCHQAVDALVTLRPQLLVGSEAEIKVKAKTTTVPHTCGQTRLKDVAASRPDPQERLPLSSSPTPEYSDTPLTPAELEEVDAAYAAMRPLDQQQGLDLGACPFPSCILAAEHTGAHALPDAERGAHAVDDESDLDGLPF